MTLLGQWVGKPEETDRKMHNNRKQEDQQEREEEQEEASRREQANSLACPRTPPNGHPWKRSLPHLPGFRSLSQDQRRPASVAQQLPINL